jgi:hypothetical protein
MVARDHGSACLNDDVGAGLAGVAMNLFPQIDRLRILRTGRERRF